jgi:signal transduction histidine kinase
VRMRKRTLVVRDAIAMKPDFSPIKNCNDTASRCRHSLTMHCRLSPAAKVQLQQMILNLVMNAKDAMQSVSSERLRPGLRRFRSGADVPSCTPSECR